MATVRDTPEKDTDEPQGDDRARGERGDGLVRRGRRLVAGVGTGLLRVKWIGRVWALVRDTTLTGVKYRVTGLAAEAAFFALLSLPPLMLGLLGTLGYFRQWLGSPAEEEIRLWVIQKSQILLTEPTVNSVLLPLIDDILGGGGAWTVLGFLLSLWSGSRALYVYIDLIAVSYGLDEVRGIIVTRLLGFLLYLATLVVGLVLLPVMVIGPTSLSKWLPGQADVIAITYWPVVIALSIAGLTTLYHVSVPIRTRWRRELPGAVVALLLWIGSAFVLRVVLATTLNPTTIYGSLATPIVVLLWLYVTALAVLIGAMVNAAWDKLWPQPGTARARAQAVQHQQ